MNNISVVLIVRNEEKNIERCLESIKWVDEIIAVEQFSRDKTWRIVRNMSTTVWKMLCCKSCFKLNFRHSRLSRILKLNTTIE